MDCHDTQRIISFVERVVRKYGFVISYFVLFAIYVRSESVYVQNVVYVVYSYITFIYDYSNSNEVCCVLLVS